MNDHQVRPSESRLDPNAVDSGDARREQMTTAVLILIGITSLALSLIIVLGWLAGQFDAESVVTILAIDLLIGAGASLARTGRWRIARYILIAIFFGLGVYASSGGLTSNFVLSYAIAILLASMLHGARAQWLTLAAALIVHHVFGWNVTGFSLDDLPVVISTTMLLIGIALLQRISTRQLQRALARADNSAEELRTEIAGRKRIEEALRANEAFNRAVIEHSPLGISVRSPTGQLLNYNESWKRIWAIPDEVIRDDMTRPREQLTFDDRDRYLDYWLADVQRIYEQGGTLYIPELKARRPRPGAAEWVSQYFYAIQDAQSVVERVVILTEDITERKKAEQALRENEAIFASFMEHSPIYVFFKDKEIRSLRLSKNYEQMLGMPISEALGKSMDELFPSDLAKSMVADDLRILNQGQRVVVVEELNGRIYETTKFPIFKDGKPDMLAGFTVDITERKRVEKVQAALYRISEAAHTARNLDELFRQTHAIIGELMPAQNFYIALYDAAADLLTFPYHADEFDKDWPPLRPGKGLTGHVLRTAKPFLGSHEKMEHLRQTGEVVPLGTPSVDWLGVPLIVEDTVLGVLAVQTYTEAIRYTDNDKDLLMFVSAQVAMAIDRKRAAQAEHDQRVLAEALRNTAAALNSTLDFDEVLDLILSNVGEVVRHDAVSIMLIDPASGIATIIRRRGYVESGAESDVLATRFAVADVPTLRQMADTRQPLAISNIKTYTGWIDTPTTRWQNSYAGAPICAKHRVLGFLHLASATPDFYTARDAKRLQAFADQAAIAIENARLYAEASRRAEQMATLNRTGLAITSGLDMEHVLRAIYEQCQQVATIDTFYVALYDPQTGQLRFPVFYDGGVYRAIPPYNVHAQPSLSGWVIQNRRTLYIADSLDPNAALPNPIVRAGGRPTRAYVGVPLVVRDQVLGVLSMQSYQSDAYGPDEIHLIETIATQAAIAIENAQLYDAVRRHAAELDQRVAARTAELEHERNRVKAILDATGDGISLIDLNGIIRYANPAAEQLTGYTTAEAVGQGAILWDSASLPPVVLDNMQHTLRRGEAWRGEVIGRRKDGTFYDLSLTINPLRDNTGEVIGYVGSQRDISHLKELERLKNQFVTRIGHELRTPLANVKLHVELLERGKPAKRTHYLNVLRHETEQLRRLIEGFLEIAELDAGVMPIQPVATDVNHYATTLITGQLALAATRGVEIDYRPSAHLPPAQADPAFIGPVIINLLDNALSYTPRGGSITVSTSAEQHNGETWVTLTVRDTGPGIPAEEMPRLFERFYRGEAAQDYTRPGAGLGLAICKAMVEKLGGRITVTSQPGQGATFTVWLRAAQ